MGEDLQLNLSSLKLGEGKGTEEAEARAKQVTEKKVKARYIPTWEEVWVTGYGSKKGILQTKISELDKKRLLDVKNAVEIGEIGTGVESLNKFSKSHALGLYKLLLEQRKTQIIADMVANKPENYYLLMEKDTELYTEFISLLYKETEIGFDTETTGLDYDKDHIVGMSFTLPTVDKHYYIPIRHVDAETRQHVQGQLSPAFVFKGIRNYLEDPTKGKILHNFLFDAHMVKREGVSIRGLKMDTLHAMKVLNENEPSYALKNLATKYGKYFGFEDKSMTYEELFGKGGFEATPLDIATVYACKDTHLCYKFSKWLGVQFDRLPKLKQLYYEVELPNTEISFSMEHNGILVDLDFAGKYAIELDKEVTKMGERLQQEIGVEKIDSPRQLANVIYGAWGAEDKKGNQSVDADTLKSLSSKYPILKELLTYRDLKKLLSTYFKPLPSKIWQSDKRLHGKFNQLGTHTGRYSSNEPNMANIPPKARPMFIAPEGKILYGADLSQQEPRCLALLSGDTDFQAPYLNGVDLYSNLASRIFHKPVEECGDGSKYRKMAKVGLLAKLYGVSPYSMSQQLGITVEEALQFMSDFDRAYPVAKTFMDGLVKQADTLGYVETMCGRKRRFLGHTEVAKQYHKVAPSYKELREEITEICDGEFPKEWWKDKRIPKPLLNKYRTVNKQFWEVASKYNRVARQAVNAVVQGSSADYTKTIMRNLYQYLNTLGEDYKLLLTIYDELIFELPDNTPVEVFQEIDRIMTSVEWFKFPMKTDKVVMYRWYEDIPLENWLADRDNYNKKRGL
ncbi:DNA polymerase [Clostridium felsineum]|uniref:DNA polymerase n=1 Tax=Clostridium felsineum TaxID=36839 RepID=UPI0009CE6AA8|nr:DNA polymerase [Clostridium felsineum]URZ16894.1 hypothetical protein CLFE_029410 [Clostridium felsineum DSM 794]